MRQSDNALVFMAKWPEPGRAKTRLSPPFSPVEAAALARAFLLDTLAEAARADADRLIAFAPARDAGRFCALLGDAIGLIHAEGEHFGVALATAQREAFALGYRRVALVGSDLPHVSADQYDEAFRALAQADVSIAPSADGGYSILASAQPTPALFGPMAWGADVVYAQTRAWASAAGLRVAVLPACDDADTAADLPPLLTALRARPGAGHTLRLLEKMLGDGPHLALSGQRSSVYGSGTDATGGHAARSQPADTITTESHGFPVAARTGLDMMSERTPTAPTYQIADRTERAPAVTPSEIYLEVTNRCNLKCHTCPQFFGMAERFHTLEWERFLVITDQFPALRRVVLHGIGEPLLNPDLGRMIRHLKGRGAYVLFNSNGLLLRGRKARDLAASGLDELRVSIDGGTPATYQAVRGVDGFDRILANLGRFAALKRELGVEQPRVSLWITGMKATIGDLPQLVRVAAKAGVGEVYLQRMVHSERGLATREQSLYGRAEPDEWAALAEATRLAGELGVTLRGSGELGPEHPDAPPVSGPAPWRDCHRPWRLMYITANGNVLPCCFAPFTDAPYAGIILGNVAQQPVSDIWDGDRYRQWRSAMLDGAPPHACAGCGVEWAL